MATSSHCEQQNLSCQFCWRNSLRARALASRKGLGCETRVDGEIPGRIKADRQELQRSVMALVHNAIKFTQKGSLWITVSWAPDKRCLRVNVRDSGPGIPKEIGCKIYEPFVQMDASASRRHSGLGLGLALAFKVVKIAGGSIGCLNPGQPGAIFELLFPVHPIDPAATSIQATGESSARDFRILAVDDNDLNRRVMRLILAKAGISSDEAASGEKALEIMEKKSFDLIFMDVQMPGMDEYLSKPVEAARLLRWIDRLRRLPPGLRGELSATRKETKPDQEVAVWNFARWPS